MKEILLAYVPVVHAGYLRYFESHAGASLYILGRSITDQFRPLVKDIRALPPEMLVTSIHAWNIFEDIQVIEEKDMQVLGYNQEQIYLPDEDVSRAVIAKYLAQDKRKNRNPNCQIKFESVFLRRDAQNSLHPIEIEYDCTISTDEFNQRMIGLAEIYGSWSEDFWRGIGALLVKDGKFLLSAFNHHVPSEHTPYVLGDPRGNFTKGLHIEISTAFHAEASLIATAAKHGIILEGAHLYVTTYPCPPCAKLIAYSGITRVYFSEGYAMLDGESILKDNGVEIIKVQI